MKRRKPLLAAVLLALGSHASAAPFDQPAQALHLALSQLARSAGLQLVAPPELVAGLQAHGVRNASDLRTALAQLLAGTDLQAHIEGDTLIVQAAPRTATLPAVTVRAAHERGGQTEGTGSYTTDSTRAATGLNLSLRETPQSVTVVTRQRLEDQNLNSLGQVLAEVPGLALSGSSGQASTALTPVYSRGYMLSQIQVDGGASTLFTGGGWTGFYGIDTALYDSVTVVRGATGLLTGSGDPSGSVNLVRKRPTDTFQASLTGSLGRWNQRRAVADVGGPLNAAGTLRGRVVALYDEGDSWVNRMAHDRKTVYAVLDADLGDATLLSLALESHRGHFDSSSDRTGFPVTTLEGGPTPFSRADNPAADWSYENQKKTAVSVALEHRFNEDWKAKLRYSHTSFDVTGKYGIVLEMNEDGSIDTFRPNRNISPTERPSHDWDLRLDGRYTLLGRQHDLIAGLNGSGAQTKSHQNWVRFGTAPGASASAGWNGSLPEPNWAEIPEISSKAKTEQYGLFLATRLHPTDDLSVILGGRLSSWKTKSVNRLTGATTDDRKESAVFTPYAGVVYDLSKSLSAYASYTEIFNPQNFKDANGRFLDPEKGKNYELGLKGEWFGGRLNASAAVFETRKDNLAVGIPNVYTPDGSPAYSAENGTKGRGWELEVSGELAPGWQLQGGYARIATKDADGGLLNSMYVPEHSFKLFTTWKPAAVQGLTVGGGVQWQSETNTASYGFDEPLFTQKSYAVASLMAQYHFDKHWHLSVNLNNVFNKNYRTSWYYHDYGAARNLQATLKYQF